MTRLIDYAHLASTTSLKTVSCSSSITEQATLFMLCPSTRRSKSLAGQRWPDGTLELESPLQRDVYTLQKAQEFISMAIQSSPVKNTLVISWTMPPMVLGPLRPAT